MTLFRKQKFRVVREVSATIRSPKMGRREETVYNLGACAIVWQGEVKDHFEAWKQAQDRGCENWKGKAAGWLGDGLLLNVRFRVEVNEEHRRFYMDKHLPLADKAWRPIASFPTYGEIWSPR